jgi:hypothetical protein
MAEGRWRRGDGGGAMVEVGMLRLGTGEKALYNVLLRCAHKTGTLVEEALFDPPAP